MPIYEYTCNKCGEEFEKLVFSTSATPECPKCGRGDVKRRPSVFGFSSGGKMVGSTTGPSCAGCTSHDCSNCK